MPSESTIQNFRGALQGQSFCPGEPGYDSVRTIPNAMIDRHPAIIARCVTAADVIACVRLARDAQTCWSRSGAEATVSRESQFAIAAS